MILVFYTLFVEALACSKSGSVWEKPDVATLSSDDSRNLASTSYEVAKPYPHRDTTLYPPFNPIITTRTKPAKLPFSTRKPPIFPPPTIPRATILTIPTIPTIPVTTSSTTIQSTDLQTTTNVLSANEKAEDIECFRILKIPQITAKCQDCDQHCSNKKETLTTKGTTKRSHTNSATSFWFW